MFIVTPTPDARPSSFWGGMNGILHPTALQWWGRQHEPMPLRWSLADLVASVAINSRFQLGGGSGQRQARHPVRPGRKVVTWASNANVEPLRAVQKRV